MYSVSFIVENLNMNNSRQSKALGALKSQRVILGPRCMTLKKRGPFKVGPKCKNTVFRGFRRALGLFWSSLGCVRLIIGLFGLVNYFRRFCMEFGQNLA